MSVFGELVVGIEKNELSRHAEVNGQNEFLSALRALCRQDARPP